MYKSFEYSILKVNAYQKNWRKIHGNGERFLLRVDGSQMVFSISHKVTIWVVLNFLTK